jgi:hypothetical protein
MKPPVGSRVLLFGLWLWLTLAVGPWWLGVILLLLAMCVGLAAAEVERRRGKSGG